MLHWLHCLIDQPICYPDFQDPVREMCTIVLGFRFWLCEIFMFCKVFQFRTCLPSFFMLWRREVFFSALSCMQNFTTFVRFYLVASVRISELYSYLHYIFGWFSERIREGLTLFLCMQYGLTLFLCMQCIRSFQSEWKEENVVLVYLLPHMPHRPWFIRAAKRIKGVLAATPRWIRCQYYPSQRRSHPRRGSRRHGRCTNGRPQAATTLCCHTRGRTSWAHPTCRHWERPASSLMCVRSAHVNLFYFVMI